MIQLFEIWKRYLAEQQGFETVLRNWSKNVVAALVEKFPRRKIEIAEFIVSLREKYSDYHKERFG